MHQPFDPMTLEISSDSLSQGEQAIRQALALQLYDQNIFTLGQARRLADASVWEFQQLLAQHNIQRHYSEIELAEDTETGRNIAPELDAGEREAIALALEMGVEWILLDEKAQATDPGQQ